MARIGLGGLWHRAQTKRATGGGGGGGGGGDELERGALS